MGINGIGKSTFLKLYTGILCPQQGTIRFTGKRLYCEQRTDVMPEDSHTFLFSSSGYARKLQSILHIKPDWDE